MRLHSSGMARCLAAVVFLITPLLGAQTADPNPQAGNQPYRFSVDVRMVVLQATVLTPKGNFVKGLQQNNFVVFEDSRPQALGLFRHADTPVAIGLIVDNSGSMRRKHSAVLAAAKAFTRNSNPKDELFVVSFNDQITFGLPGKQVASASARELQRALPVSTGSGKTALYDALEAALTHLHQLRQDKKALILISDGGDNASHHTVQQVLSDAMNSDVVIYTIGLFGPYDDETDPTFLKQIAETTGGEAFLPSRPGRAANNCKRIAQTIRNEYTLGYTPANTTLDGRFRAIKLDVKASRRGTLIARTRTGYTAGEISAPAPSGK